MHPQIQTVAPQARTPPAGEQQNMPNSRKADPAKSEKNNQWQRVRALAAAAAEKMLDKIRFKVQANTPLKSI